MNLFDLNTTIIDSIDSFKNFNLQVFFCCVFVYICLLIDVSTFDF